ncbi:MAG TPA: SDR family oxidoreductase [Hyphomicrobiales bacterium]|nr:SDR family oxidoreductase [Rhodobiaceae bacterium]HXK54343.1 SDR family oxidoreductase [Hyphomicrobiales bacterium]
MTSQDTPPVALITGAAKRIGRAIALDMATYGWAIAVHYNSSPGEAEETRDAIRRAGARSEMVCANLADGSSLPGLIDDSIAALGPLGCLINNASIFEDDDLETMSEDSWKRHMMINLRAPVFLAQHFAARLEAPAHGAIINLIDQRVQKLTPLFFSYTISKSALWTATRTLAQALAPRIRVNAVAPGPTLPNMRQKDTDFARQVAATLLGRGPEPEEIAAAVRFILDAPALTGQMIALDGGQNLVWQTADVIGVGE